MKKLLMIPVWIIWLAVAALPGLFVVSMSVMLWSDIFERGLFVVLGSTNIIGWAAIFAPIGGPIFFVLVLYEIWTFNRRKDAE